MYDFPRLDLHLTRSVSHLHAAGLVAASMVSYLMDGARIAFGYVEAGDLEFVDQLSVYHERVDTENPLQVEAALAEHLDGSSQAPTVLEVWVPWSVMAPMLYQATRLPLIVTHGTGDSTTQIHRFNRVIVALLTSGNATP